MKSWLKSKENNLFKRIKKEIEKIPVIDLHSHIKIDSPNAKNLAQILFYHFVYRELISSGRDIKGIKKDISGFASHLLPEDNKVTEAVLSKYISYFEDLKNTTTYWALNRIFKDLYDFNFQSINSNNWRLLYDKVLKTANDDNWTEEVLRKKVKARTIVSTISNIKKFEEIDKRWINKGLFSPTFEGNILGEIEDNLSSGQSIRETLKGFFAKCRSSGIISITGGKISEFIKVDDMEADRLKKKWLKEKNLSPYENNEFSNIILEIANEMEFSWVMALGIGNPFPIDEPGQNILMINHNEIPELCKALHEYKKVKIFIYAPAYPQSQEICTAARMLSNIYPMGFQWHGFFFPYIERTIEERLQVLPMNRPIGFMSDAYSTEWFYGKLSAVRFALSRVLSQMIEEGVYTEELALKIAKRWLYDNPKKAYFGGKND